VKPRALLVFVAALGCTTEPKPQGFVGMITSRSTVIDVFQETRTTNIMVDRSVGVGSPNPCVDRADVTVTAETFIARESTADKRESDAVLTTGTVVRVLPGSDPRDVCPMMINATSVMLVNQ
jgi:hypothetical protein